MQPTGFEPAQSGRDERVLRLPSCPDTLPFELELQLFNKYLTFLEQMHT